MIAGFANRHARVPAQYQPTAPTSQGSAPRQKHAASGMTARPVPGSGTGMPGFCSMSRWDMEAVNLDAMLARFAEHWSPRRSPRSTTATSGS